MAGGQDEAQRPDKAEAAGALPNEWSAASAPSQGDRQDPMPSPLFAGCKALGRVGNGGMNGALLACCVCWRPDRPVLSISIGTSRVGNSLLQYVAVCTM